mmetsp:Transcript_115785/g.327497  ORF Transcript_115785/g.327497 Transcript_115785/m.327497 type:complete len:212 (+) Transcript_115785:454-1089(+)
MSRKALKGSAKITSGECFASTRIMVGTRVSPFSNETTWPSDSCKASASASAEPPSPPKRSRATIPLWARPTSDARQKIAVPAGVSARRAYTLISGSGAFDACVLWNSAPHSKMKLRALCATSRKLPSSTVQQRSGVKKLSQQPAAAPARGSSLPQHIVRRSAKPGSPASKHNAPNTSSLSNGPDHGGGGCTATALHDRSEMEAAADNAARP